MRVACLVAMAATAGLAFSACSGAAGPTGTSSERAVPPGDDASTGGTSSSAADASSPGADCYVELFDGDDFTDDSVKITAPGKYHDLTDLPGTADDWTDEADSLKVGRDATVTVWEKTGFGGASRQFDPGSEHPSVDPEPSSLELTC